MPVLVAVREPRAWASACSASWLGASPRAWASGVLGVVGGREPMGMGLGVCGVMAVREPTGVGLLVLGRWMGVRSVSVVVRVAVPGSGRAREAPPQQAHAEDAR